MAEHLFSWKASSFFVILYDHEEAYKAYEEVWAVLKPGFLALLEDPFDRKLLDIIVFYVLRVPTSNEDVKSRVHLADQIKEHNPLCYAFKIFITGWWLCLELYLRRLFQSNSSSRLDALLEAKAKQGVQEVSIALKINSLYSKKLLHNIHENVKVLRYPDHLSHHEKLVIADYQIFFIGGLDLCFGCSDTVEHRVGDCPPRIWPRKDYYSPRESEPNSSEKSMKDELERGKYPRMPWHDVHCALWGMPCRDVARHFVQRWNHAKASTSHGPTSLHGK
ncbi:hypothetical protein PTKIN_Ptkin04bG0132100 [Pterospermum kingtungense]